MITLLSNRGLRRATAASAGPIDPAIFQYPGIDDGDSLTSWEYPVNPARWADGMTLSPPHIPLNFGHPNDTVQHLVWRVADTIAGAQAVGAPWIRLRVGTNGEGGDVGFKPKYKELLDAYLAEGTGIQVVLCHQIPPKEGSTIPATGNPLIQELVAERPDRLVWVPDCDAIFDVDGNPIDGAMSDGIHFAPMGMYVVGDAQAQILGPDGLGFFVGERRILDATDTYEQNPGTSVQYVTNPHMAGTGGQVGTGTAGGSGVVADDWSVGNYTDVTWVGSKIAADVDDPVQVPWQRVEWTGAPNADGAFVAASTVLNHPAIPSSSLFMFDIVIEVRFVDLNTDYLKSLQIYIADHTGAIITRVLNPGLYLNSVINRRFVFRNANERYPTPVDYTSGEALSLVMVMSREGTDPFPGGGVGAFDFRCASVRGVSY